MNIFDPDLFTSKQDTAYLLDDMTVRQALEKFDYHKFGVVPVINTDGTYLTTVSEGDILRFIKNQANFDIKLAENAMLKDIAKYRPYKAERHDVPIERIYKLALDQNFVPIVDDRDLFIGIVTRKDLLTKLYNLSREKEITISKSR